ncbi:MAG: hypothetical protein COA44_11250 [Arcobacter sp.]|nr:MAG: hypothetical protein COA44_11250 [Arcobacter sp.]
MLTLVNLLQANEPLIQKKKVPLVIALPLLKSIDQYSISIGTGPTQMYAFIDPVCPRSRDFVEMIFENTKMQKLYTYHFFFYELERFHTKALIADIYNSANAIDEIKKIMVKKEEVQGLKMIPKNIQEEMDAISDIAKQLDIYKRPYLFVVKPKKEEF